MKTAVHVLYYVYAVCVCVCVRIDGIQKQTTCKHVRTFLCDSVKPPSYSGLTCLKRPPLEPDSLAVHETSNVHVVYYTEVTAISSGVTLVTSGEFHLSSWTTKSVRSRKVVVALSMWPLILVPLYMCYMCM